MSTRSDLDIVYKKGYVEVQLDGLFLGSEDTKHDALVAIRNGEYDEYLIDEPKKISSYKKRKKSSLVRLIKDETLVYILMNDQYMSPDSRSKMTKITSSNNGWVRAYFNVQDALDASSKRNPYYDVYKVWIKDGKILIRRGFRKMNDDRIIKHNSEGDNDEDY